MKLAEILQTKTVVIVDIQYKNLTIPDCFVKIKRAPDSKVREIEEFIEFTISSWSP